MRNALWTALLLLLGQIPAFCGYHEGSSVVDIRSDHLFPPPKNQDVLHAFDELNDVVEAALDESQGDLPQDFPSGIKTFTVALKDPMVRAGIIGTLPESESLAMDIRAAIAAYREEHGSMAVFAPLVIKLQAARESAYRSVDVRTERLAEGIKNERNNIESPHAIEALRKHMEMLDALSRFFDRDRLTQRAREVRLILETIETHRNEQAIAAFERTDSLETNSLNGESPRRTTAPPGLRQAGREDPEIKSEDIHAANAIIERHGEAAIDVIRQSEIMDAWRVIDKWRGYFLQHSELGTAMQPDQALVQFTDMLKKSTEADLKHLRSIDESDPDYAVLQSAANILEMMHALYSTAIKASTALGDFFTHIKEPISRIEGDVRTSRDLEELEISIYTIIDHFSTLWEREADAKYDRLHQEPQSHYRLERHDGDSDFRSAFWTIDRWRRFEETVVKRHMRRTMDSQDDWVLAYSDAVEETLKMTDPPGIEEPSYIHSAWNVIQELAQAQLRVANSARGRDVINLDERFYSDFSNAFRKGDRSLPAIQSGIEPMVKEFLSAARKHTEIPARQSNEGWRDWDPAESEVDEGSVDHVAALAQAVERWRQLRDVRAKKADLFAETSGTVYINRGRIRTPFLLSSQNFAQAARQAFADLMLDSVELATYDPEAFETAKKVIADLIRLHEIATLPSDVTGLDETVDRTLAQSVDLKHAQSQIEDLVDERVRNWTN